MSDHLSYYIYRQNWWYTKFSTSLKELSSCNSCARDSMESDVPRISLQMTQNQLALPALVYEHCA